MVAEEDLETDNLDAIKAFTQAVLDTELYSNMPVGFAIERRGTFSSSSKHWKAAAKERTFGLRRIDGRGTNADAMPT